MDKFGWQQYSSSSEWMVSCDSQTPISSVETGTGGISVVLSGKLYFKSILQES